MGEIEGIGDSERGHVRCDVERIERRGRSPTVRRTGDLSSVQVEVSHDDNFGDSSSVQVEAIHDSNFDSGMIMQHEQLKPSSILSRIDTSVDTSLHRDFFGGSGFIGAIIAEQERPLHCKCCFGRLEL